MSLAEDDNAQMAHDAATIAGVLPSIDDSLTPPVKEGVKITLSTYLGPFVVFVLFIAFWEWMHRVGMEALLDKRPSLLPSPVTVIDQAFLDSVVRRQLLEGLWWTTYAAFIGLAISIALGMLLAVFMAQAVWAERSIYPYLVALQATPVLAIVP
ncbi:MAG: ABC transporter permease, partial [Ilumatobacteraceae bacterium]